MKLHTLYLAAIIILALAAMFWAIITRGDDSILDRVDNFIAKLRGAVRSKTVWFNGLALVFLQQLPNIVDYLAQNAPVLQPFIPANHYQFIVGAIAIANLILRYKTTHALEAK
jgi:hypothetical protein